MSRVYLSNIEEASVAGVGEPQGGEGEKVHIHPPFPDSLFFHAQISLFSYLMLNRSEFDAPSVNQESQTHLRYIHIYNFYVHYNPYDNFSEGEDYHPILRGENSSQRFSSCPHVTELVSGMPGASGS